MRVILYQPEIPQNCGNIVRTCAVAGCDLVLVRPLGFSVTDRWLKRAGLDYWLGVQVTILDSLEEALQGTGQAIFYSSKASRKHVDIRYNFEDSLVFGSESAGFPEEIYKKYVDSLVQIPMRPAQRCLNLATSVGIGVYEAWRQLGFSVSAN